MSSSLDDPRFAQTLRRCNGVLDALWATSPWQAGRHVVALEAGGGSFSHFRLPGQSTLLALDIDYGQLCRNSECHWKLQADLHALPLCRASVDVVVCFNVIEHLEDPDAVLVQLAQCLRDGGVLVLGCPDRHSLKGLITRLSPLGWHRAFYRFIVRKADRGDGHFDAFATPFGPVVTHSRLVNRLQSLGYKVLFSSAYDGAHEYGLTQGSWLRRCFGLPYYALGTLGNWLTLGRWRALQSDLLYVMQKGDESPD
ncbi:AdoMet_MTases domain containing protein [Comamonadaceae bacterium]